MDGTSTVTSHLKYSTGNDYVTRNSYCKGNILGPNLTLSCQGNYAWYIRSPFGAGPQNTGPKRSGKGLCKNTSGLCTDQDLANVNVCAARYGRDLRFSREAPWGQVEVKAPGAMEQNKASPAVLTWASMSGKYVEFPTPKSNRRLENLLFHTATLCCWKTTGVAAFWPSHFPAVSSSKPRLSYTLKPS